MTHPTPPNLTEQGLTLTVESHPSAHDIDCVEEGLTAHAAAVAVPFSREPLGLFLREAGGDIAAGLIANWYATHGAVIVKDLWVAETRRGAGLGRVLMTRLEDEVRARGCGLIHLDTFDFQARGFYETLGYVVFGDVTYPKSGRRRFFLSKSLE